MVFKKTMIRFFDFSFSFVGLIIFTPLFFLVYLLIWLDKGSPIFYQKRIGKNHKIFILVKFRTMKIGTLSVGTHLSKPSDITAIGKFLRITKIDELPQLFNVLKGEMSFVGPRPCLPNQKKLIAERKKRGIFRVLPGITGLAQINGINMSTPLLLAKTEKKMIEKINLLKYFSYIFLTFFPFLKKIRSLCLKK